MFLIVAHKGAVMLMLSRRSWLFWGRIWGVLGTTVNYKLWTFTWVIVSGRLTLDMPGLTLPKEGSPNVYRENTAPNTFTDLNTDRPYQDLDDHQPGFDCKYNLFIQKPLRFASEVYCFCTKVTIVRIHNIVFFFPHTYLGYPHFLTAKFQNPCSQHLSAEDFILFQTDFFIYWGRLQ